MSKVEFLYVKGMNMSESEHEDEDVWDDKKLNEAYDKAVSIANAEIAKRIAMSTNKNGQTGGHVDAVASTSQNFDVKTKSKGTSKKRKDGNVVNWKVGMPCRAVYEEDGFEYEAFLLRILNDKDCVVRFLGYENSEVVSLNMLKPSLGNKVRAQQIEDALNANGDSQPEELAQHTIIKTECTSARSNSPASTERSHHRKKKSSKKRHHKTDFQVPVNPMFNCSMPPPPAHFNFSSAELPMPPPPPLPSYLSNKPNEEDEAVHSMLLSWYMTGYYTGLYQGMKRGKLSSCGHHHH